MFFLPERLQKKVLSQRAVILFQRLFNLPLLLERLLSTSVANRAFASLFFFFKIGPLSFIQQPPRKLAFPELQKG